MPGMGGHAFAVEVGKLPSPPPVLYISAYEKPQGEMAKRFLQKPFSIADLTAAVARLLPQDGESEGPESRSPRPTLDPRPPRP